MNARMNALLDDTFILVFSAEGREWPSTRALASTTLLSSIEATARPNGLSRELQRRQRDVHLRMTGDCWINGRTGLELRASTIDHLFK